MAIGYTQGYVELGGQHVVTDGRTSVTNVQKSYPGATVTVYNAGTLVLATIFSDSIGTPKANPFVADSTAYWGYFANEGSYDVVFSGAGITSPFSLLNWRILASAGIPDPGSNGIVVRTALNTVVARTIQATTSETVVTNGDGVAGNPIIGLAAFLEFTGKSINGGTFISPIIPNFGSAQHNHENAAGGGQLNATNVFSAGTVPIVRLPAMVGATGVSDGSAGLVPAPLTGQQNLFLRGDATWQSTGGGGGIPGSPNLSLQYNNAGAFGGVTGSSSDGTQVTFTSGVLRATSPRITTSILDSNGNSIIGLSPTGTAVNQITISNAAAGGAPSINTTGTDANININWSPKGTGINFTTGNLQISNNAPQVVWTDVNDSKQFTVSLNGSNFAIINNTLGTTPLNIDTTNNDLTSVGNIYSNKTSPVNIGRSGQPDIQISNTTGVVTFQSIPVLPGSDPTTSNQAVRKAYVDGRRTNWSMNWFIADPTTFPGNSFTLAQKVSVPALGTFVAIDAALIYNSGTASGSFSVQIRKHPLNDQTSQTTLVTMTMNSGSVGVGTVTDINPDVTLTANDWVYVILSAISSPLQRDITISLRGTQLAI